MVKSKRLRLATMVFIVFIAITITGCSTEKNDGKKELPKFLKEEIETQKKIKEEQQSLQNFSKETQIIDGVQTAYLSWGKLNYEPAVIKIKRDMPTKIIADTSRLQGCFRSITIPDLGISKSFSENDKILEFTPTKKGTFGFGCSMGMGSGTLIVE